MKGKPTPFTIFEAPPYFIVAEEVRIDRTRFSNVWGHFTTREEAEAFARAVDAALPPQA